jgi:hypothetical protein
MRTITLDFESKKELDALLEDQEFLREIAYLKPEKLDEKRLILFDPIEQHSPLDSEKEVLTIFSYAIKRILFSDSNYDIEFLVPKANPQRGGLKHNTVNVINSTTIQQT